jgi:hypothetical protein
VHRVHGAAQGQHHRGNPARRHNVGAINWGFVAGKTQTYFPWDSWEHPYRAVPKVWFHDLLRPDGQPFQDADTKTIQALGGSSALVAQR